MNTLKTLLAFLFAGAFVGGTTASLLGPRYLEWYNTAAEEFGTQQVCNLPVVIRKISERLIQYQLYGSLIGAGVGLVLGILIVRALNKRRAAKTPPTTPATPAV